MNELKNINCYIQRTKQGDTRAYQMNLVEMLAMAREAQKEPAEMICLAFDYGKAKGYRAAKAEQKKGAV